MFLNSSAIFILHRNWPKPDIKKKKIPPYYLLPKSNLCFPESHSCICITQMKTGKMVCVILYRAIALVIILICIKSGV